MNDKQILGIGLLAAGIILSPTIVAQLGLNPIDDGLDAALVIGGLALLGAK